MVTDSTRPERNPRRGALLSFLAAAVVVGFGPPSAADSSDPAIIVVVNDSVPMRNMDFSDLRQLALGTRRFWYSGQRVELIVEAGATPGRRAFVNTLSGMSELQFQQYWLGQVFNQRATRSPRAAPDRRLALAMVSVIPGALTLVVDGPLPPRTRILTIGGMTPDDPRYPLR